MKAHGVFTAGLLLLTTTVSGCGYVFGDKGVFRDRSNDYKKARYEEPLAVPPELSEEALGDAYIVPDVVESVITEGEFEVPRPTPLAGANVEQTVRIQRLGNESWALFRLAPGQLWPQVRSFLAVSGLKMAHQDAQAGIMDSAWVRLESATEDSRFRFRIDQGIQRGSSELHVLQMNRTGGQDWPQHSDNQEQEQNMLKAVAQFVANRSESASVSMLAERGISAEGRVVMQENKDGETYLELALPFYRAWASLPAALEKSSFEISDRNRDKGLYYVRFLGKQSEEESGWFDWMWGDDEDPVSGQEFVVTLREQSAQQMRIDIDPAEGAEISRRDRQRLLLLIKGNLN